MRMIAGSKSGTVVALTVVVAFVYSRAVLASTGVEDFKVRYPLVAANLERARQTQSIECTEQAYGYNNELVSVSDELFVMKWPSILNETTFTTKPDGNSPLFRAVGGTNDASFKVMKMDAGLQPQLASYAEQANSVGSDMGMRPLFAATCCWESRLADLVADPVTRITSVSERSVDPFGDVLCIDFTRLDSERVPVENSVYLDPSTWAIRGARMAILAHKPGRRPEDLNSQISYQLVDGVQMPQQLEFWSDSPSRPGLRFNSDSYRVTRCSLSVSTKETFTVDKYGLVPPQSVRHQAGFRWFLWLNVAVLVGAGIYFYLRSRRTARS